MRNLHQSLVYNFTISMDFLWLTIALMLTWEAHNPASIIVVFQVPNQIPETVVATHLVIFITIVALTMKLHV